MTEGLEITAVRSEDTADLADIHINARCAAMPYLPKLFTADEVREWFIDRVQRTSDAFHVARCAGQVVGYIWLYEDMLDDLYVSPGWQPA